MVLCFECVDEILKCNDPNEKILKQDMNSAFMQSRLVGTSKQKQKFEMLLLLLKLGHSLEVKWY